MKMFNSILLLSIEILVFCSIGGSSEDNSLDWWKHSIVYQVYLRSFKDSDGDGIGDIKGFISKLDHFEDLGIDVVWMSSIHPSPNIDFGYDVTDYTDINPEYGTMGDFEEMMRQLKKRGMKFLIDLVPNHTSDEHIWFTKSVKREYPYTDYYIWKDPKGHNSNGKPRKPTNWRCLYSPCWTWNEERKHFYYNAFHKKQPDLNLRNPLVVQEIKDIMRFWIEKGVNGFRLDATNFWMEDAQYRDWIKENGVYVSPNIDLWDSYLLIHELREFVDKEFQEKDGQTRILVAEAFQNLNHTMLHYDKDNFTVTHFPYNFFIMSGDSYTSAGILNTDIRNWLDNMPDGAVPNWTGGTHDTARPTTLFGEETTDLLNTAILLLPGISCPYYGQEIGMSNIEVKEKKDTMEDRDGQRSPMQWDDSTSAGFSENSSTWLPVNPNYWYINVRQQMTEENSNYNNFKRLSKLRKSKSCKFGDLKTFVISRYVYAFTRSYPGEPTVIALFNFDFRTAVANLDDVISVSNVTYFIEMASENSGYSVGFHPKLKWKNKVILKRRSCIVLTTRKLISQNAIFHKPTGPHSFVIYGGLVFLVASIFTIVLLKYH